MSRQNIYIYVSCCSSHYMCVCSLPQMGHTHFHWNWKRRKNGDRGIWPKDNSCFSSILSRNYCFSFDIVLPTSFSRLLEGMSSEELYVFQFHRVSSLELIQVIVIGFSHTMIHAFFFQIKLKFFLQVFYQHTCAVPNNVNSAFLLLNLTSHHRQRLPWHIQWPDFESHLRWCF